MATIHNNTDVSDASKVDQQEANGSTQEEAVEETVAVTANALLRRINRALEREGEGQMVRKLRGQRWRSDLGDYYAVNPYLNTITAQHIDLEQWGREMKVLHPWEYVVYE